MSLKANIVAIQLPPLGKLIDTLEEQPAAIQEPLRKLRQARADGVSFATPAIKALAADVLRFYVEHGLERAGVDSIVTVEIEGDGSVEELLRNPTQHPPEIRAILEELKAAGANPDLAWDKLPPAAQAAVKAQLEKGMSCPPACCTVCWRSTRSCRSRWPP